jgi:hypothetical protein
MRRSLVLTNEAARHPFRQILPPPVVEPLSVRRSYREPLSDRALFSMTFVAAFLAFSTFLG